MKKENLIGRKFHRLLVIQELIPLDGMPKKPRWKCLCDCGNIIIVNTGYYIKSGNTKSCGCLRSELVSKSASKRNFNNRKYEPKIAAAKRIYRGMYDDGNLPFEIFLELSQQNCYYCGVAPSNTSKINNKCYSDFFNENAIYVYNGLDRVDNELPHNIENVVACCKYCNYAKRQRSVEEFYIWIDRLYHNIQTKKPV